MRARSAFGNRDNDRLPRPRLVVTQRHAAHSQIDRELLLIYGKQCQIHSLEIALPNRGRGAAPCQRCALAAWFEPPSRQHLKLENSPPEKIDYFGFVLPSLQF